MISKESEIKTFINNSDIDSVVEHLPSVCEAMGSNLRTTSNNNHNNTTLIIYLLSN